MFEDNICLFVDRCFYLYICLFICNAHKTSDTELQKDWKDLKQKVEVVHFTNYCLFFWPMAILSRTAFIFWFLANTHGLINDTFKTGNSKMVAPFGPIFITAEWHINLTVIFSSVRNKVNCFGYFGFILCGSISD